MTSRILNCPHCSQRVMASSTGACPNCSSNVCESKPVDEIKVQTMGTWEHHTSLWKLATSLAFLTLALLFGGLAIDRMALAVVVLAGLSYFAWIVSQLWLLVIVAKNSIHAALACLLVPFLMLRFVYDNWDVARIPAALWMYAASGFLLCIALH